MDSGIKKNLYRPGGDIEKHRIIIFNIARVHGKSGVVDSWRPDRNKAGRTKRRPNRKKAGQKEKHRPHGLCRKNSAS